MASVQTPELSRRPRSKRHELLAQGPLFPGGQFRPPTAPKGQRSLTDVSALKRVVDLQVVPRLVLAHRERTSRNLKPVRSEAPSSIAVEDLTRLILGRDEAAPVAFVEATHAGGASIETVLTELLAPVARSLGTLWVNDACSFADVTLGLWRLEHIVHRLRSRFRQEELRSANHHETLLVPMPGEHHTFGLMLVAEFFRRGGWTVLSMPLRSAEELIAIVRGEWFSLIGLSLSCGANLDRLSRLIATIRRASRNPSIVVMVGGNFFIDHPEQVRQVGADLTAPDGRQAPQVALEYMRLAKRH